MGQVGQMGQPNSSPPCKTSTRRGRRRTTSSRGSRSTSSTRSAIRPEAQDTTVLLGPMTTRTASGPHRGEVEAVLSYLASLGLSVTLVGDGETAA
jgi:hypothetical protein